LLSLAPASQGIQGEVQGMNTGAQSLGRVVGPLFFLAIYPLGIEQTYLLAGILCAIAFVLISIWIPRAVPVS